MQAELSFELKLLATVVGISIVIAVVISLLPKKKTIGGAYFTAEKYFEHLKKNIILVSNIDELKTYQASIEGVKVKSFRGWVFRSDRRRYYKQLKELYKQKERELILHPTNKQLCKS